MDNPINILLFDDDGPPDAILVIRCFSTTPDVSIHVITSKKPEQVAWKHSRYVYSVHYISSEKDSNDLEQLLKTIEKIEAHVLLPITESTIKFISENKDIFKNSTKLPPIPKKNTLDIVTNKWTLNQFLQDHGFPHPKSLLFDNYQNVQKNATQLNFPILLKPVDSSGGTGISKFDNSNELFSYLNKEDIPLNSILFQEVIIGYKIGINLLANKGKILAYSIQKGLVPEKFGPSHAIEFTENEELLELAKSILSELNWSGIANLDFYFDTKEKKLKLVDFNARYWSSTLGSHCAGINFPYLACLTALKKPYTMPTYSNEKFLLTKAAIKETIKNFTRKEKIKFNLKQTNIYYIIQDPMPEIRSLPNRLFKR